MRIWGNHRITTFQIIALGFLLMILVGTLLLMLPVSGRDGTATGLPDCLFMATSAVCVTGLVVLDTSAHWSPFGQAVILFLIQIGGMGVVTAALSLSFLSGRRIGFMQRSVMQEAISAPQVGGIVRLTRFIILTTLGIELAGALVLMAAFVPEFGWARGTWYAVFHSVSAFCNAGFDLMGVHGAFSSMTAYAQNALVNIVLVLLITIGGIGFLVWNDVKEHRFRLKQYRLQSKIALAAPGIMILVPFLWFLFSEMDGTPLGERVLPSLFQSVPPRFSGKGRTPPGRKHLPFWRIPLIISGCKEHETERSKPESHPGKEAVPYMRRLKESIVLKSIMAIIVPLALLSLIVSVLGFRGFTDGMLELYEQGAVEIAGTAAAGVDADRLDAYVADGGTSADYREVWSRMDQLCNTSGATFIYVIRPDLSDYGHITFLFSTINHESSYSVYEFGYTRETTNDEYRTKYRALYDGTSSSEIVIRDRGYIETDAHITAMVPLKGADGKTQAILCVQRQMEGMSAVRNRFVRLVLVVLIVLVIAIIIGQHIYLRRQLLNPIRKITEEAVRFAAEEAPAERKLAETITQRDEIGKLAGSIDHMEEQIAQYMDQLTQVTAEKERISTELSLATRIQADMLPRAFPAFPDRTEFDIYASMTPAKEVGGDFYDFFLIDHDHLALVMADVSGKGVPAALFMMASKIIIKNIALTGVSPREILEITNNRICQNNNQEMFVTVWLGILDLRTGDLTAVNAGHEYPVVTRSGGSFELLKDKHGFVVGGLEGIRYKEYELKLEPGQELFLYTDGVPEATNADKELYGTERMMKILNSHPDLDPKKVLEEVKADVDRFVGQAPQFDDLTMLCIKYNGPQE